MEKVSWFKAFKMAIYRLLDSSYNKKCQAIGTFFIAYFLLWIIATPRKNL